MTVKAAPPATATVSTAEAISGPLPMPLRPEPMDGIDAAALAGGAAGLLQIAGGQSLAAVVGGQVGDEASAGGRRAEQMSSSASSRSSMLLRRLARGGGAVAGASSNRCASRGSGLRSNGGGSTPTMSSVSVACVGLVDGGEDAGESSGASDVRLGVIVEDDVVVGHDRDVARDFAARCGRRGGHPPASRGGGRARRRSSARALSAAADCSARLFHAALDFRQDVGEAGFVGAAAVGEAVLRTRAANRCACDCRRSTARATCSPIWPMASALRRSLSLTRSSRRSARRSTSAPSSGRAGGSGFGDAVADDAGCFRRGGAAGVRRRGRPVRRQRRWRRRCAFRAPAACRRRRC